MTAYEVCDRVAVVDEGEDAVYVASLPDGPIVVLHGVAADIWRSIAAGVDESEIVAMLTGQDRVADDEVQGDDVREGVRTFLANLITRGLVRPAHSPRTDRPRHAKAKATQKRA